jgi:MFS family permease
LTFAGILSGIGYLLMSQVTALWQLYVVYGLILGIGLSGMVVPLMSTIARWFSRRTNFITGIVTCGGSVGALLIPLLASQMIDSFDWRTSYLILGGSFFVLVTILSQFMRRDPNHNGQLTHDEERRSEQLASNELSLKEAFGTKQFWLASAIQFISGFLLITATVHIVPHATDLGISNLKAAGILAIIGGASILGRIAIGVIGDSFGIKQAFIVSFIAIAASYFWLPAIQAMWMLYLFAIVFGIFNNRGILVPSLVTKLFGLKEHGLIYGVLDFIFCIGSATGPLLAGYLFDISGSYTRAFVVCGALGIVGTILSSQLRQTRITKYLVES